MKNIALTKISLILLCLIVTLFPLTTYAESGNLNGYDYFCRLAYICAKENIVL